MDPALASLLGVTAQDTVDVERRVLAEAELTSTERPNSADGEETPVAAVARLEAEARTVEHELSAVEAAMTELNTDKDANDAFIVPQDVALRQAVGQSRLAGLKGKHAEIRALLGQARAKVEQTRQGSLVEEAHPQGAVTAAAALPSPVTLIEDDGLDVALSQPTLVETERDRLIRTGMLTPFDRLNGFERRVRHSVTAARDNANAILNSRPQTRLLTADEIPKQYAEVRPYTAAMSNQRKFVTSAMEDSGRARLAVLRKAAANRERESRAAAAVGRRDEREERCATARTANESSASLALPSASSFRLNSVAASASASSAVATGDAGTQVTPRAVPDDRVARAASLGLRARPATPLVEDGWHVGRVQRQFELEGTRRASNEQGEEGDASGSEWDVDGDADKREEQGEGGESSESDHAADMFGTRTATKRRRANENGGRRPAASRRRRRGRAAGRGDVGATTALEASDEDREEPVFAAGADSVGEGDEHVEFEGGFTLPAATYNGLYDYQQTGVKWLWELHNQSCGGIIGDEMGLGKTVQVAAFLTGLHRSGLFRPSLVVCPATMLRQWKRELRLWCPAFSVGLLHDSAVSAGQVAAHGSKAKAQAQMLKDLLEHPGGVVITTYEGLRVRREMLLPIRWGYVILDEGHKIRNPDADITLVTKQLQTVHRLIMTGSPIQNRLTELWSLFDFVFPGKLGTLPVFQAMFSVPIGIGGYATASALQVSTAYKCAVTLRDIIAPYLLRRLKADVNHFLPKKTEQVLFCPLSAEQRTVYRSYLNSEEVEAIMDGNKDVLGGIDTLKKICNHPDLLERIANGGNADYGNAARSGKMLVLERVLRLWFEQGHRCLLFTQTQQMLDILEALVCTLGLSYRRMDGCTAIGSRMRLIDEFNNDEGVFVFLLTTRVGGLGVNLCGANRVVLFDPDWNPCNDTQARERAWRIGQKKEVTVYRLITQGTIEEKIYHRQIFKQFLSNKILRDPRQRRFFKAKDISDLFTFTEDAGNETADIFAEVDGEIQAADLGKPNSDGDDGEEEGLNEQQGLLVNADSGGGSLALPGGQVELYDPFAVGGKDTAEHAAGSPFTSRKKQKTLAGGGGSSSSAGMGSGSAGSEAVEGSKRRADKENMSMAAGHSTGSNDDDAAILRSLLGDSGVKTAMNHDALVGASNPEVVQVNHEADRVARRAAEALRESRSTRRDDDVSVPTWTGRSGASGAPAAARRRFGNTVNPRLAGGVSAGAAASGPVGLPISVTGKPSAGLGGGAMASSSAVLSQIRERRKMAGEGDLGVAVPASHRNGGARVATAGARVGGGLAIGRRFGLGVRRQPPARLQGAKPFGSEEDTPVLAVEGPPPSAAVTRSSPGVELSVVVHLTRAPGEADAGSAGSARVGVTGAGAMSRDELMAALCAYLTSQQGAAPSAAIVEYFQPHFRSQVADPAEFRKVLRQVALLQREVGQWQLRPEFA